MILESLIPLPGSQKLIPLQLNIIKLQVLLKVISNAHTDTKALTWSKHKILCFTNFAKLAQKWLIMYTKSTAFNHI